MHKEGHYGAAMLVYAPIAAIVGLVGSFDGAVLGAVLTLMLAMLPDIDMKLPIVKHRGITHTVWFAIAVGIACGVLIFTVASGQAILYVISATAFATIVGTVAILSHIAADALTPMGVRPLRPIDDRKYCWSVARAANPLANKVLFVFGASATAVAFVLVLFPQ